MEKRRGNIVRANKVRNILEAIGNAGPDAIDAARQFSAARNQATEAATPSNFNELLADVIDAEDMDESHAKFFRLQGEVNRQRRMLTAMLTNVKAGIHNLHGMPPGSGKRCVNCGSDK